MNDSDMVDVLALDQTLAMLVLGVGVALLIGNGLAIIQHRRGSKPKGEEGEFRAARVYWLLAVGVAMTIWAIASF